MNHRYRIAYGILKSAMTREEAKETLGLTSSYPSEDEVKAAYKAKALEHHPDRGGAPGAMAAVNVARDLLLGLDDNKQENLYDQGGPVQTNMKGPSNIKREEITWEQALQEIGGVPDANWIMVGPMTLGGYEDNKHNFMVFVGQMESNSFVFLSVTQSYYANMFEGVVRDICTMDKTVGTGDWGFVGRTLKKLYSGSPKNWNGKVTLLPPGSRLTESLRYSRGGKSMDLAHAVEILEGATALPSDTEDGGKSLWEGKKLTISFGISQKSGLTEEIPFINVNGREFVFTAEVGEAMKKYRVYDKVFGTYYYPGTQKLLNRIKNGKVLVTLIADVLEKVHAKPDAAISALRILATQLK